MTRTVASALPLLVCLALAGMVSCRSMQRSFKEDLPDNPDLTPTLIDYVDTDGFDALFEVALVSQDPVIVIRTGHSQPDWDARLNAWIAAWNRGDNSSRRSKVRGQSPLTGVPLDKDSIREFRLLVTGLLDRVEELAQSGSSWWVEERARSRRVALLRPYSLRFHMDEDGLIQLVFFHGNYANSYPQFVQQLMRSGDRCQEQWARGLECSCCRSRITPGKLTSRGGTP
jgi:hypothetical protein